MDFGLSPQEESFREAVRAFLRAELPAGWQGPVDTASDAADDDLWAISLEMRRKLAARGWLSLAWPRQYGGLGASHLQQIVFDEGMAYHRAPGLDIIGGRMVGPALMEYGTEEQKRAHLGAICRGEVTWCQGFTEPDAGSDLASLQTRAEPQGDGFVITGQKVYTGRAHRAQWCALLARTNPQAPKHKGISYFLVDMSSPGVVVRPLVDMMGRHFFNQLTFDGVWVPRSCLVGEQDQGWYAAVATLNFERTGIDYSASARRTLEDIAAYTQTLRPRLSEVRRRQLADRAVETQVSRWLAYRVGWLQAKGLIPSYEASMSKAFGSELLQRLAATAMGILGPYAVLAGSRWAPLGGWLSQFSLRSISATIPGGTTEVQRNIIATRGLGLPR
ncbi:MAG: acyl-CoA dehydrogenase family protein [Chloroflexi bacterium]|nr:acyl-CoA dehydrogenase family protein [Chloroflexota bacterium]